MSDVAVNLLRQYIRLNTSNPPGNEHLAAAFFSKIFESEGIEYKTYEYRAGGLQYAPRSRARVKSNQSSCFIIWM